MNKEETLIKYRGQLKYIRSKYLKFIELIDNYISRIEDKISKVKDKATYEEEAEYNKDLIIEIETLFDNLGE